MSDTDKKPDSSETEDLGDIVDAEVIAEHKAEPRAEPMRDAAAPAPKPAAKSFMARAGWVLAFGLAAFIGGVAAAPSFDAGLVELGLRQPPPPVLTTRAETDPAVMTAVADLKAALVRQQEMLAQHEAKLDASEQGWAALKADVNSLASTPAAAAPATDPAQVAELQAQVERLSGDIARLTDLAGRDDPAVRDLSGALALARAESNQLKTRLASLETAMKAVESGALEASPRGRLVLSLGRIKERALAGQPFGADLAALEPDFAALPTLDQQRIGAELAVLEQNGIGIRATDTLTADFDAAATAAMKAADKADGSFLTGLFTVRRTDAGAEGLEAQLAKAERSLYGRDVAGAITALEGIEGPAAGALEAWLSAARAHVAVDTAFSRLTATVARMDEGLRGAAQ
ncbi:MAG: hypothetical protein EP335_07595 [Alphaproteobacteria bacterium]|nr:MAG: hypothetical protein EP335_07595 [Alphaproteobacteria bacterium]